MAAVGIKVTGLRETVRSLERMGVEVADLKAAFRRIGSMVADEGRNLAPKLSRALADSIRPGNAKAKAIVRAGSARVPYAGVLNYGGYHNIEATHFLDGAVESKQGQVIESLEDEVNDLIKKLDLI